MSALAAAPSSVSRRVPHGYRRGPRAAIRWLAAEPDAGYHARSTPGAAAGGVHLETIRAGVAGLSALDVDACSSEELGGVAAAVQVQIDGLTVVRDRIAGTLRRRAVVEAGPGRERRAVLQATRDLGDRLGLSPSEAKQASERGKVLQDRPHLALATTGRAPTGDAADDDAGAAAKGRGLRPEQIAVIGRILAEVPPEHVDRVEAELVAAAQHQHATELGRTARRLLAKLDAAAANRAEERRHRRRRLAVVQTPDGMTALSGQFSGVDAETVRTAVAAFSTPDIAGETARTPDQRTADGLVAALRAALDAGTAPADRGVKPHILVLVPLHDIPGLTRGDTLGTDAADGSDAAPGTDTPGATAGPAEQDLAAIAAAGDLGGVAELAWTGPIPAGQIRRLLSDAHIRLLGIDLQGVPIAMSQAVNQPTEALYLALVARDGGCRYPGCDAPPGWCDIAHATARRDRGPLTIHNALLLCRRHHRKLDHGNWTITIDGPDATFTSPNGRRVRAGPARGRPADTS